VPREKVNDYCKKLPRPVVHAFTKSIQPILLNGCAAAGCHGDQSKNDFRLHGPLRLHGMTQQLTRRNLYSVLQTFDPKEPEKSPLLAAMTQPHGGLKKPIFSAGDDKLADNILLWARQAFAAREPAIPESLPRAPAMLSQTAGDSHAKAAAPHSARPFGFGSPSGVRPVGWLDRGREDRAGRVGGMSAPRAAVDSSQREAAFTGRDPFDPAVFNRRYSKDGRRETAPAKLGERGDR